MNIHRILIYLGIQLCCVEGFTEFAGDCEGDGPAVGGLHLNNYGDGSRLVYTGQLNENRISFFVDGIDLTKADGKRISVPTGVEQTLEIVSQNPFKGALIRLESTPQDVPFTLTPMIKSQEAVACVPPVLGITHTNNSLKRVLSAGFRADETGEFTLDITVVDFNNATGSVYWYSQLYLDVVDEDVSAPGPTPRVQGGTFFPTFAKTCNLCNGFGEVSNLDTEISVEGEATTCRELQDYASERLIPPESCTAAQAAALEYCGCSTVSAPSTSTFAEPTILPSYEESCYVCGSENAYVSNIAKIVTVEDGTGSCLDLQAEGINGYIEPEICVAAQLVAQQECGCVTVNEPTGLPTYKEPCFVCGSENAVVSNVAKIITLEGGSGSCLELQADGENGFLDPDLCLPAQIVAQKECGCIFVASPSSSPSPVDTTELPTYSEKCIVCGTEESRVTLSDTTVYVAGGSGTCAELEWDGLNGYIEPSLCGEAQATAVIECGCTTISPAPSSSTFEPTVTPLPTYSESCNLCIVEGWKVSILDAEVTTGGEVATCLELQEFIDDRLFPPELCQSAQAAAAEVCGCAPTTPGTSPALNTFAPTSTAWPTSSTYVPTYQETCYICETGRTASYGHVEVVVDDLIVTCSDLEEAALDRMLPPEFCAQAKDVAQKYCGCVLADMNAGEVAAPTFAPSITALPTHTPLPTFSTPCHVCGSVDKAVSNPSTAVELDGLMLTCGEVQDAGESNIIPPDICPDAVALVVDTCGCTPATAPTAPTTHVATKPTITIDDSFHLNDSPTSSHACYICGESAVVSKPDEFVAIGGLGMTCNKADEDGLAGMFSPILCDLAKAAAEESCGCNARLSLGGFGSGASARHAVNAAFALVLAVFLGLLAQ